MLITTSTSRTKAIPPSSPAWPANAALTTIKSGSAAIHQPGQRELTASGKPLPSSPSPAGTAISTASPWLTVTLTPAYQPTGTTRRRPPPKAQPSNANARPSQAGRRLPATPPSTRAAELLIGDSENVKGAAPHLRSSQTNTLRAARAGGNACSDGVAEFGITLATGRPETLPEQPHHRQGIQAADRQGRLGTGPGRAQPDQQRLHQQHQPQVAIDDLPEVTSNSSKNKGSRTTLCRFLDIKFSAATLPPLCGEKHKATRLGGLKSLIPNGARGRTRTDTYCYGGF